MLARLRAWAQALRKDLLTLWFCRNLPGTPWYAKLLAALIVAYAFSPIDLIPDFIPVIGYLDDLIIVPLGIYVTLRLIPEPVLVEARARADVWLASRSKKPRSYAAAIVFVLLWIAFAYWVWTLWITYSRAS